MEQRIATLNPESKPVVAFELDRGRGKDNYGGLC